MSATPPLYTDEATRLLLDAERAATLRAHRTDPAVVALAVDRARIMVERTMWLGIGLGMAFTTVTVQEWAARGHDPYSMAWFAAWLQAPLVEVPLLAILRGESTAARYGVPVGRWARKARWTLLIAAYVMNTYDAWSTVLRGSWDLTGVLQHSVPVIAVLVGVEALTDLREALHRAITAAGIPEPAKRAAKRPAVRTVADQVSERATPPAEPVDDARPVRAIGVEWAVANWRTADDPRGELRPVEIGEALMQMGRPISKGERSRIKSDAAALIAAGDPGPDGDGSTADVEPEPVEATR